MHSIYIYLEICWRLQSKSRPLSVPYLWWFCSLLGWSFFNIEAMSQAPRKSTRATKGQPPEILDPAKGLGLASSKDTRESNAAEPLAGEADVFTTPRKDAIPASTVLDGASPAKIVAKRPGLCAKAVARKRAIFAVPGMSVCAL